MDPSNSQPVPSSAAQATQAPPAQAPQQYYPVQGAAALAPPPAAWGQVVPFQSTPSPQPPQQGSAQDSTVSNLINLATQLASRQSLQQSYQSPEALYQAPTPGYQQAVTPPAYQPYLGGAPMAAPQVQGYPQTSSTGTSSASSDQSLPLNSVELQLVRNLSDPAALQALEDPAPPVDSRILNATGIQLEEQLNYLAAEYDRIAPMVEHGRNLYELFADPAKFPAFSEIFLDQLKQTPGGFDIFMQSFVPVYQEAQAYRAQIAQQEQQQQVQQQPQQPTNQYQQRGVAEIGQGTQYVWGNNPNAMQARQVGDEQQSFQQRPGLPVQAQGGQSSLADVPPSERWKVIDQLERTGQHRNIRLIG